MRVGAGCGVGMEVRRGVWCRCGVGSGGGGGLGLGEDQACSFAMETHQLVKLVGGVLGLAQPNLVQGVLRLIHITLVDPRLRIPGRLPVAAVDQIEDERHAFRLEIGRIGDL